MKVGDLVIDTGVYMSSPAYYDLEKTLYGVITRLPYSVAIPEKKGLVLPKKECIVCEILWAGNNKPTRLDMEAFERGWIKIVQTLD